jgi:hypothetical protein
MPFRVGLSFCIAFALVALPSSAHAAVVAPSSTSAERVVPAGGARTVTLSCPGTSVALSAAVTRQGRSAELLRSVPSGHDAGDWLLTFGAGRGAGRRVDAELRCVRLRVPAGVSGARLSVQTESRTRLRVPAGGTKTARVSCAPGYVATGWGFRRSRRGELQVAAAVPSAGGWRFELENAGAGAARAAVSARCLKRVVRGRRGGGSVVLRFRVVRRAFEDVVAGGRPSLSHRCRGGQYSLAAGHEVNPLDAIALVRSGASSRSRASWTFAEASAGDAVTTHVVCLARGSRFG